MNNKTKKALIRIIELTAYIDTQDNSVWGCDTDIGNINDLLKEAHKIIKPLLKVIK